jgi:GNAT superfamily N-acetyltransferase
MNEIEMKIKAICEKDFDSLRPLIEEFVSTHPTFSFRENYWSSFCIWLKERLKDENSLSLCAIIENKTVGFVVGIIQENGPLLSPDRVGYVSIMVVDKGHRKYGIGVSLWNELRRWFVSSNIKYFELYTEFGNKLSSSFWANRGFNTFLERRRANIE